MNIRVQWLILANWADDFQLAFRDVWGMPYVVLPVDAPDLHARE